MIDGKTAIDLVRQELASRGYQGRIVSYQRLHELEEEIHSLRRQGKLTNAFCEEQLTEFCFDPPQAHPDVQSILIIAVPRPQTVAKFNWRGKSFSLILPPTYTDYQKIPRYVAGFLTDALHFSGYWIIPCGLPLKLLAVHSGLAVYGRNNITYVSGMGSFLELAGFYSNIPCHEDQWQEAKMMESCHKCRLCLRHCPAGAIRKDRFLLDVEKCIVLHNERPSSIPFPSWMDPSWHNCLIGCMICQRICPENRDFIGWFDGEEEFSEEETALLLKATPQERLSKVTIAKLERLDLLRQLKVIPRNLGMLLKVL